jgi:hypothetical protein
MDSSEADPGAIDTGQPATSTPREEAIDTVPADVLEAAKSAFALRDRSAAVLELLSDSLLDEQRPLGPRRLQFGQDDVRVALTVHEAGQGVRLELTAEQAEVLEAQVGDTRVPAQATAERAWAAAVDHGLLSVLVRTSSGRARTAWLRI